MSMCLTKFNAGPLNGFKAHIKFIIFIQYILPNILMPFHLGAASCLWIVFIIADLSLPLPSSVRKPTWVPRTQNTRLLRLAN